MIFVQRTLFLMRRFRLLVVFFLLLGYSFLVDVHPTFSQTPTCGDGVVGSGCSVYDSHGFEGNSWGIWNDGGADALLVSNATYANNGSYSLSLQDDTTTSVAYTDPLDFSDAQSLQIAFSYYAVSMDNINEDFFLEINTGAGFVVIQNWAFSVDFVNNTRYDELLTIYGPFSSSTVIRFRLDASGNADDVYFDDIVISTCGSEECDDGNLIDSDGCSATCSCETDNDSDGITFCGADGNFGTTGDNDCNDGSGSIYP